MSIFISIHAPRAGRDPLDEGVILHALISIHAPRAGRDAVAGPSRAPQGIFQSTRPVRGATGAARRPLEGEGISIHAPRAGRDQ